LQHRIGFRVAFFRVALQRAILAPASFWCWLYFKKLE
jgi:hypothetical protein